MVSPRDVAAALRRGRLASALLEAAGEVPCHWVGGVIRDRLLGRASNDVDALVERDGERIAARLETALRARLVPMGRDDFAVWRLVGRDFILDLLDRRQAPLELELGRRDFTINALALRLDRDEGIVDLFGGIRDIASRRLRIVAPQAFEADPLRILRAARLAAQLGGFRIEQATIAAAAAAAARLDRTASERMREELELLFSAPDAAAGFTGLADMGIFPALWNGSRLGVPAAAPPRPPQGCDRPLCRWLFSFLVLPGADAAQRLAAVDRLTARRLLPRDAARTLRLALAYAALPETEAEQRRWLHALGVSWPVALAAYPSGPSTDAIAALASRHPEILAPRRLVTAAEVAALAGGLAGPALGAVLRELRDLQVTGAIADRGQALSWLTSRGADSAPSRAP